MAGNRQPVPVVIAPTIGTRSTMVAGLMLRMARGRGSFVPSEGMCKGQARLSRAEVQRRVWFSSPVDQSDGRVASKRPGASMEERGAGEASETMSRTAGNFSHARCWPPASASPAASCPTLTVPGNPPQLELNQPRPHSPAPAPATHRSWNLGSVASRWRKMDLRLTVNTHMHRNCGGLEIKGGQR